MFLLIYLADVKLASVLSDQVLYSWGGKDIVRKVIVLSSLLPESINSALKETLMVRAICITKVWILYLFGFVEITLNIVLYQDAADKCVSVEFILLEQRSNHLSDIRENINSFSRCISDLDNCSFQSYLPGFTLMHMI